jgi:hypothetical protein
MSDFLRKLFAYLGYERLNLDLDEESRGQVMRASIAPLIVIVALAVQLWVDYRYEGPFFAYEEEVPTFWQRTYGAAYTIASFGLPLAVALLFASGIARWTRPAGSWMTVIGLTLVILSVGFGVSAAAIHVFEDPQQAFTLRSQTWASWSYNFAFLAIGYFFVAYRAGHPPTVRLRRSRPVPRRGPADEAP